MDLIDRGRSQFHIPVLCQEGANINKSLTTLGKVISALADLVSPEGWKEKPEEEKAWTDSS